MAEITDSLVKEHEFYKISKNLNKNGLRYVYKVASFIPSTKFARQAAAFATTLGTGSYNNFDIIYNTYS